MNTDPRHDDSLLQYWQPRYWPLWLAMGLLRLLVLLPYPVLRLAGRGFGALAWVALPSRRAVAAANLRLCFPELDDKARGRLLRRHFASLGTQVVEIGLTWWASDARVRRLTHLEGLEHLHEATRDGRGAILLSAHLAPIEFAGRRVALDHPQIAGMYRANRNPMADALLRRARLRITPTLIPKESMRAMIRCLARGVSVWYAADQSYRRQYSVLVPFFGEPAMTNAALTHIARIGKAPVVPFVAHRLPGGRGYTMRFEPALADFPSADPAADALRVNAILERWIREAPEEYYWIHRRFKGRGPDYPDPYGSG
ncbi:MAG: lipid A biosynthesis lauroyl acyltransferase [Gammaproteobacteria bacterium]|nr:lipid A biosynthesis lauroyl acyltransferase [Gammaproteobacteria bacterium]